MIELCSFGDGSARRTEWDTTAQTLVHLCWQKKARVRGISVDAASRRTEPRGYPAQLRAATAGRVDVAVRPGQLRLIAALVHCRKRDTERAHQQR
jgi:hypothetical protein